LRDVHIRHGDRLDECVDGMTACPFTPVVFPDLPGVKGGMDSHIAVSLTWNGRDDLVRPTDPFGATFTASLGQQWLILALLAAVMLLKSVLLKLRFVSPG
jgi:hypothetical protein